MWLCLYRNCNFSNRYLYVFIELVQVLIKKNTIIIVLFFVHLLIPFDGPIHNVKACCSLLTFGDIVYTLIIITHLLTASQFYLFSLWSLFFFCTDGWLPLCISAIWSSCDLWVKSRNGYVSNSGNLEKKNFVGA